MKIKAISLWQPWADLMATGHKTIETRSWPTKYRGPLLICAARTLRGLDILWAPAGWLRTLHFGKAVAIVDLVDCIGTESLTPQSDELLYGDFSPCRFAWITNNRRQLANPFPVRCHQGFFNVEIDAQLIAPISSTPGARLYFSAKEALGK